MPSQKNANNKRIAKNTIFLYIRLLITTVVGLYTSRVILHKLGVEDFGIYGVVGSIVSIFSMINSTMSISTYRFLNVAVGKGDKQYLSDVFKTSLFIHIGIAVILILVAESIGPWLISNKLTIPYGRLTAAHWVFQFSLITCVFMVISAPYSSSILVHEKMDIYAYFTVFDTAMKLLIVYLIGHSGIDKLIEYSCYLCCLQILTRYLYNVYCKRKFEEARFSLVINKKIALEMFNFTSWNMFHCFINVLYIEGLNMILNIFFGPVANAARAIAMQIQSKVMMFGRNMQEAFNPQIMKSYASGNLKYMQDLVVSSSKYSFILLWFFILPLCVETKYVLTLWLGNFPEYTIWFARLVLVTIIIDALQNPLLTSVHSTGKIKWYSIFMSLILLFVLPCSYLSLSNGMSPYIVFIIQIIFMFIGYLTSLLFVHTKIKLQFSQYLKNTILPIILIITFSLPTPLLIAKFMDSNSLKPIIVIITSMILIVLATCLFGLNTKEKNIFIHYIKKRFNNE